MKLAKTALVIALASVGTMAAAESQVTLYGTIDGAVVVNKAKGGDATVSLEDGIAGGSVWGIEGLFFSTVTPGQFPTVWCDPVKALNKVVLPQLGLPASAIDIF